MTKYSVTITEPLVRILTVEAKSADEAQQYIERLHANEDIVLDSSDFIGVEFTTEGVDQNEEADYTAEDEA